MNALIPALAVFTLGSVVLFFTIRRHYEAEFRRIASRTDEARAAAELLLTHRLTGMIW